MVERTKMVWIWKTNSDACPLCAAMEGGYDEEPSQKPPLHPNCNCEIVREKREVEGMPEKKKISHKGINFLKKEEGNIAYQQATGSYKDGIFYPHYDGAGFLTIGYGHKMSKEEIGKFNNGISEQAAEKLLEKDIKQAEEDVNVLFPNSLKQNQVDSLISFTYNLGRGNIQNSNTADLINRNLPSNSKTGKTLEDEFKEFNKACGKTLKGLTEWRKREWNLFKKGEY